ncbi:hypothetical protein FB567DRAFT_595300 [Paraphoma chrysanthemicola]|uniref:Kelch repeat protein n=1 Tax=Paraphoma chrysanthemicola TaxID=798071 RepID=A0A8K0QZB5_9PLEO|nr:hypothetical protein FB567DRAFT_595300 [Paraphoma chrysanthemicola]
MLVFVFYCLMGLGSAANSSDQIQYFCRRFEHRTTVVNNKLYIDGGKWNQNAALALQIPQMENLTNTDLLYSDLLVVDGPMPKMQYAPSTKAQVPSLSGGALWADEINSRFYAFGGYQVNGTPPAFQTWSYDTSRNTWESITTTGDLVTSVAHGMSAIAPDAGTAFYLGGYHDSSTNQGWMTSRRYTPNLIEFDLVNRRYTNHSGPNSDGRGEGLMVFVPASNVGLLIYFGGLVQSTNEATIANMAMDTIWIYDISLHKWYQQKATGDVPEPRSRFCGTVAWPDDKSSFNMYMLDPSLNPILTHFSYFYGGLAQNGTAFDDLYLLSLPSFTWLRLFSGEPRFGHHSMTCDIINGTQMIVMGGTFPSIDTCDAPEVKGQHNVDMGTIMMPGALWYGFNQNNPPYRVPDVLVNVIGGTVRGGANITGPKSNRTYDRYLFEKEYKVPQRYPTPVSAASATAGPTPKGLSRGVLVGIIVGSIAGGVLIGLGVFYFVHIVRRRARGQEPGNSDNSHVEVVADRDTSDDGVLSELQDNKVNEMENIRSSEMAGHPVAEMWAEPAELAGHVVAGREGGGNSAHVAR